MIEDITLNPGQKVFFASDAHLGEPDYTTTRDRERKLIAWIDRHQSQAAAFFFLGDVFDFWFEYPHVVPKGFTRLFGKLAHLTDSGIPVYFFTGNHDLWLFDYLTTELSIPVFQKPQSLKINQHTFHIGHGDGLGPGEPGYKILKAFFTNRLYQWLFKWLHPNVGFAIANFWSRSSRSRHGVAQPFVEKDQEWIYQYCKKVHANTPHDFYIFGHRHLALELEIEPGSMYFNIGEWISKCTYGVYDGASFRLDAHE